MIDLRINDRVRIGDAEGKCLGTSKNGMGKLFCSAIMDDGRTVHVEESEVTIIAEPLPTDFSEMETTLLLAVYVRGLGGAQTRDWRAATEAQREAFWQAIKDEINRRIPIVWNR